MYVVLSFDPEETPIQKSLCRDYQGCYNLVTTLKAGQPPIALRALLKAEFPCKNPHAMILCDFIRFSKKILQYTRSLKIALRS